MSANGTVVYISSFAVDGSGTPDPFMLQELPWLLAHFGRVLMVSYFGAAELTKAEAKDPSRIVAKGSKCAVWQAWLHALFAWEFWQELFRLAREGKATPKNIFKLLLFTVRGHKLHFWLEEALRTCDLSQTTLYAYWMSYDAYAASLSRRKHAALYFLARGHAFDIDVERNPMNPYLMKRFIAKAADGLFLISEYAKEQYMRYMDSVLDREKLHVVGVGSVGKPVEEIQQPPFFQEGALRLVSCATINEIKQLPVLIDALSRWEGAPVSWLHMGGGPKEEAVRDCAAEKLDEKSLVSYQITGRLANSEIQSIYEGQAFDVFVNTSRMEGVPVSIMEAMRFGIPVIAPGVGGIPELVDGAVGMLYEVDRGAEGVLDALKAFVALSREQAVDMRMAAQKRWEEKCRSDVLLPLLFAKGGEKEHE